MLAIQILFIGFNLSQFWRHARTGKPLLNRWKGRDIPEVPPAQVASRLLRKPSVGKGVPYHTTRALQLAAIA